MTVKVPCCPHCQSTNITRLFPDSTPFMAELLADGEKCHVPKRFVCRCENGHSFSIDFAVFEASSHAH